MNPTPTISEAARLELVRALKEAQQIADKRHSPVVEIGGFWVSEALSALDSAHPAPKEGATPETDAKECSDWRVDGECAVGFNFVPVDFARSLELRLSEARRKQERAGKEANDFQSRLFDVLRERDSLRSHLKTANELLGEALLATASNPDALRELSSRITTHLNQQSK